MQELRCPFNLKDVLFQRKYKSGYIYRRELVDDSEYGGDGNLEMVNCYSADSGKYIGSPQDARFLCVKKGITKFDDNYSIGFNEKEQKWFGWSHRAIFGFGIGSTCKRGDCHYRPVDKDDFLDDMIRFWSDDAHINVTGEHRIWDNGELGVYIEWENSKGITNESMRGEITGCFHKYPDDYGKGEWKAETLEDARQMAIDFAGGVS